MVLSKQIPDLSIRLTDWQSPVLRHAARELSHYLAEITGRTLPVYAAASMAKIAPAIHIGLLSEGPISESDVPTPDSFAIMEKDGDLYIAGHENGRGTLYGVYAFLEELCGCRFYASDCTVVPAAEEIVVPKGYAFRDKPAFLYRETFYSDTFHGDTAARLRLNGDHQRLLEEHGGKMRYVPGYFVHSFSRLVPPAQYFTNHPEYFALRDGRRDDSPYAQLCLTNPEVLEITKRQALADLRAHPECAIISISQNDGTQPCQCAGCQKIASEEGSEAGPIIRFVNEVAAEIEKEFPDVWVDTLAYDYSRKPPKFARPRENVIVRLCTFECCFAHPLKECREIADTKKAGTDPIFRDFAGDIEKWAEISHRLFIWDYVTDFEFYHNIHPNFHVLKPNMQFFASNKVLGVFPQGNGQSPAGEMAELRAFLLAKLLWNPSFDVEAGTTEFLGAWFGPAAPEMAEYLALTRDALLRSGYHLSLYDEPVAPFITKELLDACDAIFDRAERAVANDPLRACRVAKERIAIRFTRFFHEAPGPDRASQVEAFISDGRSHGIARFSEKWGTTNIRRLAQKGVWPPEQDDQEVIRD